MLLCFSSSVGAAPEKTASGAASGPQRSGAPRAAAESRFAFVAATASALTAGSAETGLSLSPLAGPTCTQILGALGADVVKIEHPQRGDEARAWGPRFFDGGSVLFFAANASKRSLALDIKSEHGQEVLRRLVN